MRLLVSPDGYVNLAQLFASCSHPVMAKCKKIISNEPGIELHPLQDMPLKDIRVAKDMWAGSEFEESMVYLTKRIEFESNGTSQILNLQLPRKELDIMKCLYGNWNIPSTKDSGGNKICHKYNRISFGRMLDFLLHFLK